MRHAAYLHLTLVVALAGCYGPSFKDCEVTCATGACPSGLSCVAGVCRAPGMTGACGVAPDGGGGTDGSGGGSGSGSDTFTIDQLKPAEINSICETALRCNTFEDMATCVATWSGIFGFQTGLIDSVKAGKILFDGNMARACIDANANLPCDRSILYGGHQTVAACAQMFAGTVHANGACVVSEECISQNCQINTTTCVNSCCMGVCIGDTPPPLMAQPGQPCGSTTLCMNGYCDGTTNVCQAYKPIGATCSNSVQCAPGNECYTAANPPTCRALVAEGGQCNSSQDCLLPQDLCISNGPLAPTCTKTGLSGTMCANTNQCQLLHKCSSPQGGTCTVEPGPNMPCTAAADQCIGGSYCNGSTCVPKQPDGTSCNPSLGSSMCQSDLCDQNTMKCVSPPACT